MAQKLSGLPVGQVIGTGTSLDSARFRLELSKRLHVAENSVHAYILGEHGDSQFAAWSTATVAGKSILSLLESEHASLNEITTLVCEKANKIIKAKGVTCFGIAAVTISICSSIFKNANHVRPVSHYLPEYGLCLSMPAVIGSSGIVRTLVPDLSQDELSKLQKSVATIAAVLKTIQ